MQMELSLSQPRKGKKANRLYSMTVITVGRKEQRTGLTDTDWQDEVMRTAPIQSHNLSLTGGTQVARYFVSANYMDDKGIVIGPGFSQMSTWHIEDGSYLRIRNITFGITLPQAWMNKASISRARIYFSSQNPFTCTINVMQ
jgi:hypothetical protein